MSKKWVKLEEILKDGIKATKEAFNQAKTKAQVGSKKVSLYMIKNQLKENLAELGAVVYRLMIEEEKQIKLDNKTINTLCNNITEKKKEIQTIQEQIEELKDE